MIGKNYSRMLLGFALATNLIACGDRKETLLDFNTPPELFLIDSDLKQVKEITDSIRYYDAKTFYNVKLKMRDIDDNLFKCKVILDSGAVEGYYKGKVMALPSIRTDQEQVEISLLLKKLGNNQVTFSAEDTFSQTDNVVLNLFVFDNLPPVAVLNSNLLGEKEYEFDASESHDLDEKWGGKVAKYTFTIDGLTFETPNPKVRHIFSLAGNYTVTLTVTDNNGAKSKQIEQRITVK